MSASRVIDLAVQQGLLDEKTIVELRQQIAESKFVVTPEAIAKVLVDHGQLTPFQARKLVSAAAEGESQPNAAVAPAPMLPQLPTPMPPAAKPRTKDPFDDLTFADEAGHAGAAASAPADDDIIDLEPVALTPVYPNQPAKPAKKPVAPAPPPPAAPVAKKPQPPSRPAPVAPAAPPPQPEEEIVDLEPALPPTRASAPAPPTPANRQPTSRAAPQPVVLKPVPSAPAPAPVPVTEELVPLMPVTRPQTASSVAPPAARVPAAPVAPTPPLAAVAPPTALAELQPLSELGDPLLTPLDPLAPAGEKNTPEPRKRKGPKNVWDSPLLLIGGGGLGVMLIAFALLLYSLTRGSAAEMLAKANEEYQKGSYTSAIAGYDKFLKGFPDDPNVSLARVKRGMALIRQVSDTDTNPAQALKTAQTVLPTIETEPQFAEARPELSSILPDIADAFAEQAGKAKGMDSKIALVDLANQALELVNNPTYIPASLKKDREVRIAGVADKLKVAQRSIDQDKDLATAVTKIGEAAKAGNAAEAYRLRAELLKVYPGLEAHPDLVAAIRGVGDRERELIQVESPGIAAVTDDDAPAAQRIVLAVREGAAANDGGSPVFMLVEGAVYGFDSANGRLLWRRHVGYQTLAYPLALPGDGGVDALAVDSRSHQLLRLKGISGEIVWRQPIGEPFAQPIVGGVAGSERIYVTTRAGRLLDIDGASGEIATAAQLPQQAGVAGFYDPRQNRLLQLGKHSTLFVLPADSLQATETYYVGHKPGAIFVPPVAVLDHVLVVESPADDHSLIHVLITDPKTKRLAPLSRPFRLDGRITTPLAVSGRRVAAVTDLGQVAVYEVDPSNKQQPVRSLGGAKASEQTPLTIHTASDGNRVWIGGRRATGFEIQAALQQVNRQWTRHQNDAFLGPFLVSGSTLIHARRRQGWPGVAVEGCDAATGETRWTVQLAVPVVALAVSEARKSVDALTAGGRLFALSGDLLKGGIVETPAFPLLRGSGPSIHPEATYSADGNLLLWAEEQKGGRLFTYDTAAGTAPADVQLTDSSAATAPQLMGAGLLVPLTNGSVALLERDGTQKVQPFMPPLAPGMLPLYRQPALLADGRSLLISDGRRALYRVTLKDQPQPHLAQATEVLTEPPLTSSLIVAGSTVFGLTRGEAADTVIGIDPAALPNLSSLALQGRVQAGPYAVGGLLMLAAEPEGLVCLEAGPKIRWQQPLSDGPLAGPPLALADGDVLVIHQSGVVRRVAAETGETLGAPLDAGQPLGPAARVLGTQLFLTSSDGVVQRVPLPPRP